MVAEGKNKKGEKVVQKSAVTHVVGKTKKQQELVSLSNDEIFDQIMAKKKARMKKVEEKKEKTVNKVEVINKKNLPELSNDEIYEKIKAKRRLKEEKKLGKEEIKSIDKKEDIITDFSSCKEEKQYLSTVDKKRSSSFFKTFFKFKWCYIFIFALVLLSSIINIEINETYSYKEEEEESINIDELEASHNLQVSYDECFNKTVNEIDSSDEIVAYIEELNNYFADHYRVSIKYEDLNRGFTYSYNPNVTYYAASTIKALDALYIYTKAYEGALNLDTTLTYTKKYRLSDSFYMKDIAYNTEVSLRDLVKFSILASDNSAHAMLVDYIGYANLKNFGLSLGATKTLSGYDNFGYIDVQDAIIYMKALEAFFNNGSEFATELREIFILADQNDLRIDSEEILAAHKYGEYDSFYHDIGIVYDRNPYVIAILTSEGNHPNFEGVVQDINEHVYQLHRMYNENREKVCLDLVYNN